MNWQSDFVSPHIVSTPGNNAFVSKNSPNSMTSVQTNSPQNSMNSIYLNGAGPNNNYRLISGPTNLNSSSIPSFSNLQYNQALMSSSVPQFSIGLNQDMSSTASSSSSSTSSSNSTNNTPVSIVNSNFQYQSNIQSSKNLVLQVLDALRRCKIKLVAFDFDCTIVNVHTGGQWIDSAEKLAEYVRPCFREILAALLRSNEFFVCVVTYSPQEDLIREVLRISLKDEYNINELVNRIVIKGNTREFVEEHGIEGCYSNGKQIHLQFCRRVFEMSKRYNKENNRINDENVILIDDDVQNLKIAHEHGHHAFQVNNSVQLVDFFNFLKEI